MSPVRSPYWSRKYVSTECTDLIIDTEIVQKGRFDPLPFCFIKTFFLLVPFCHKPPFRLPSFLPFCLSAFLPFCLSAFRPFCLSALSHREGRGPRGAMARPRECRHCGSRVSATEPGSEADEHSRRDHRQNVSILPSRIIGLTTTKG